MNQSVISRPYTSLNVTHADLAQFNLLLADRKTKGYTGKQAEFFRDLLALYRATQK